MGMKRSQAAQWAASTFFTKCSIAISVGEKGESCHWHQVSKTDPRVWEKHRLAPHFIL